MLTLGKGAAAGGCFCDTIGPMAVLGSAASPSGKAGMAPMTARLTWSSHLFGTRRRVPAAHAWPLFMNAMTRADGIAWSRTCAPSFSRKRAGVGTILSTVLGLFLRLPNESIDLTPWNHWRLPLVVDSDADAGPVLVTVEYHVKPERVPELIKTMRQYGRIRRRDGASRWGICRDLEIPNRYLETFVVSSWAKHLLRHDRLTRADSLLEERLRSCTVSEPNVRHFV